MKIKLIPFLWSKKILKSLKYLMNLRNKNQIFNVFGHTIFSAPVLNDYSCAIDLGCYHEKDESKLPNPRLCALEFPSMKIYTQESLEKISLK